MSDSGGEASLEELMAVMAHDLNNPIAALITNLSFLESALAPGMGTETAEALGDAQMLCDVLRRLASNLDLVARRGGHKGAITGFDVALLGREAIGRLGKQASAAEVGLVLDPSLLPGQVCLQCDRALCGRALENLLAFGIERATPRSTVTLAASRSGDEVRIEVRYTPRAHQQIDTPAPGASAAERRRYIQATYGRGLSLYCVRIAATSLGCRLDTTNDGDGRARLCLVANRPEER